MEEFFKAFASSSIVQSAAAVILLLYGYTYFIKKGESDAAHGETPILPSEAELRARIQMQNDMHDMSENLKQLVALQTKINISLNRLVNIIWNRQQTNPNQPEDQDN